jgi:hypothetical protein
MMLDILLNYRRPWWLIGFHILLGVATVISPFLLVIYFYALIITSFLSVFGQKNNERLPYFLAYVVSFEMLARLSGASPYIPYELSKYFLFIIFIYGIINGNHKGKMGAFMCLLLIPALFYDLSEKVTYLDVIFNFLGPLDIALAIWFFTKHRFTRHGFLHLLRLLVLPLLSSLVMTIIKTPDFSEIDFSLGANFQTTAGFGPNQVSTVFGVGMFLSIYLFINKTFISGKRWLDVIIIALFTFQGLLSFSRGGMIGGLLGIVLLLVMPGAKSQGRKDSSVFRVRVGYIIFTLIALSSTLILTNRLSEGNLLLRYQGETYGTLHGAKEKNIETVTTGRFSIFMDDLDLFIEHNIFGVGVGASRYLRKSHNMVVAHTEPSRLIAEHGLLGIIFLFLLLVLLHRVYRNYKNGNGNSMLLALLIVGIYTTFHSSTRTYIPLLLIGLSTSYIIDEKDTILR